MLRSKQLWDYKVHSHHYDGNIFIQINVPKNSDIDEYELVIFQHGQVVERQVIWPNYELIDEAIHRVQSAYSEWKELYA